MALGPVSGDARHPVTCSTPERPASRAASTGHPHRRPGMHRPTRLATAARLLAVWLPAAALAGCTVTGGEATPTAADLVGTWSVDLRPTPTAAPYLQEFVVTGVQGQRFTGTFYGAPISQARLNSDWGTLRIAFVTTDGSGPYHHSAVLNGRRLEGLTHSTGRDFLAYWSATRK